LIDTNSFITAVPFPGSSPPGKNTKYDVIFLPIKNFTIDVDTHVPGSRDTRTISSPLPIAIVKDSIPDRVGVMLYDRQKVTAEQRTLIPLTDNLACSVFNGQMHRAPGSSPAALPHPDHTTNSPGIWIRPNPRKISWKYCCAKVLRSYGLWTVFHYALAENPHVRPLQRSPSRAIIYSQQIGTRIDLRTTLSPPRNENDRITVMEFIGQTPVLFVRCDPRGLRPVWLRFAGGAAGCETPSLTTYARASRLVVKAHDSAHRNISHIRC